MSEAAIVEHLMTHHLMSNHHNPKEAKEYFISGGYHHEKGIYNHHQMWHSKSSGWSLPKIPHSHPGLKELS